MKIAYFDCQFGAGGDMLVAALLDAGIDMRQWQSTLNKIALPVGSFKVIIEQVERCSLRAKKLNVLINGEEHVHPPSHSISQPETLASDNHGHSHRSKHDHHTHHHNATSSAKQKKQDVAVESKNHQSHHDERTFKDIAQIIEKSHINQKAKELAYAIFEKLAKAEGYVHGIDALDVHFHEVGAIDSIIDILGFAIAYDLLAIEKTIVSPLPLGSGTVQTQHGLFPIPGPATLQILQDANVPISDNVITYECLTPTAAAILTTIANEWGTPPAMETITATGYGAGTLNPQNHPNVSRVIIGDAISERTNKLHSDRFSKETVYVIETMLDDFSPQNLSYVTEQLLELGALDAYINAVTAKKGRSGHLLTVLCLPEKIASCENYIFEQTSTLGLRIYPTERCYLERRWVEVSLDDSQAKIKVKIGKDLQGKILSIQPEYDDCIKYAKAHGIPLKTVIQRARENIKTIL